MELIHGGDRTGFLRRYGREALDFSASLNACGMPYSVLAAATAALHQAEPYPDPLCRELADALARRLGVGPEHLVFGNGAADVLFRLALALRPGTALVPVPTFAEYERALSLAGSAVRFHPLRRETGFVLDESVLPAAAGADCVFLCQPNNPTGRTIPPPLLAALLAGGATLVVDECFRAFLDSPERHSLLGEITSHPNLIVLDSFTKLYAMAGIRLGYAVCGSAELAERTRLAGPPWQVSTVAQAAGLAALADTGYVDGSLAVIRRDKHDLVLGLTDCGATVLGADANFVFFHSRHPRLDDRLAERGILIRNCANFRGLEPGYYRVAVRTSSENAALLRAVREIVGG